MPGNPPLPGPGDASPNKPGDTSDLPLGITALDAIDPTSQDGDLASFDSVVGTTEMIGLGETVHTSGGYHRVRTRLVRHMIEKLGFRAVALETPWAQAMEATRYVESCAGTPLNAVQSVFPVFASVQMEGLLEWMCGWNKEHPEDKVAFWGFDIQDPWSDGKLLREYVARVAPSKAPLASALDACFGVKFDSVDACLSDATCYDVLTGKKTLSPEEVKSCEDAWNAANDWLRQDRVALVAASSEAEVRTMELAVDAIGTNAELVRYLPTDYKRAFETRDAGMARALLAMRDLRSPGKRVAIIAHNGHLAHAHTKVKGPLAGIRAMGQMLKEDHKAPFEAIGLLASVVKINWAFEDPPVADGENAVERRLRSLDKPALFVDLAKSTFLEPGKSYEIAGESCVPHEQFRALVYLQESEAMVYAK